MNFMVGDVIRLSDGSIHEIIKMITLKNNNYLLLNVENGMDLSLVKVLREDNKTAFVPLSELEYMNVLRRIID